MLRKYIWKLLWVPVVQCGTDRWAETGEADGLCLLMSWNTSRIWLAHLCGPEGFLPGLSGDVFFSVRSSWYRTPGKHGWKNLSKIWLLLNILCGLCFRAKLFYSSLGQGALWRWSGLLEEADFSGLGEGLAFQPVRNRFNPAGQVHHLFKGLSIRKMGPPLGRWIHLKPCWRDR